VTRLRLHHRIVIPFVLVALVATAGTAWVALSVVSRTLEARVRTQVQDAADMVSRSDFAMNPKVLQAVRQLTGADVLTYTTGGAILATTLDRVQRASLVAAIMAPENTRTAPAEANGPPLVRAMTCDGPCYVAYRRLADRPDTIVALVAETKEATSATRAITRTILLAAALSVVVLVVASQIVASRVTAPINLLVAFTHDASAGDPRRRAPAGDDEIGRLGGSFNDMLDRLDRSHAALVRSEKLALAGVLAARVAHDIRNPLSAIKMQAQLLEPRLAGHPDDRAMLDAILHDIELVESVVRDLIELARPGELNLRPARVNDVVNDALRQMTSQLQHRRIRVEARLDETLPAVSLDADRFKQALLNVIVNAADAMTAGGTLEVVTRPGPESTIELDVCDDGVGVNPDLVDRVFDPFVSTKRDGVGLGLVNARAVVESHGGRIVLVRREPQGTRVRITLPVITAAGLAPARPQDRSDG
jgi:signal transduction histidine kinase